MNGLRVPKIVKEIKTEGVKGELEAKIISRDNHSQYLGLTLVFIPNSALREKFNFCFSKAFC